MIPELGQLCLVIALCLAFVQAVLPMIGAQTGSSAMLAVGKPTAHGQFLFLLLSFVFLARSFLVDDFWSVWLLSLIHNTTTNDYDSSEVIINANLYSYKN